MEVRKSDIKKASLTIEAALILPIFLYLMVGFIYFFQVLSLHEEIQNKITKIGLEVSKYGYLYEYLQGFDSNGDPVLKDKEGDVANFESKEDELEGLHFFSSLYFKNYIKNQVLDVSKDSLLIKDGEKEIHTYMSSFMEEEDQIHIVVHYKIRLPFGLIELDNIPIVQRVSVRAWTGERIEDRKDHSEELILGEDYVYVTQYGKVYHNNEGCTYIFIKVEKIKFDQLLTSEDLGKLSPCNLCITSKAKGVMVEDYVFVTRSGSRYHSVGTCSSLNRTVRKLSMKYVEDYDPCSRCYRK